MSAPQIHSIQIQSSEPPVVGFHVVHTPEEDDET